MEAQRIGDLVRSLDGWTDRYSLAVLALALLLLLLLISREAFIRRLKRQARKVREGSGEQGPEVAVQRRIEGELEFFFDFVRELSSLLYELNSLNELRRIPPMLMHAVLRIFQAEQAAVLVRRKSTLAEPDRNNRLIVVALAAPEHGLAVGSEVVIGEGHLGIVAQCQRVMDRGEIMEELAGDQGPTPIFDAAAPMVVQDQTIGVIASSRHHRRHSRDKEILQMLACLGTMTWHNIAAYRHAKVTADIDELTGIYNKRFLKFRLSELVYDAHQKGTLVSVFLFDIDNFKNYNDSNGHLAGDRLLRLLSRLVRDTVRADDIFGRFGGEEFLLVMPERSPEEAMLAASTVRRRIEAYDFPHGETQPLGKLTVSGGVATFPNDADDSVELVQAADEALYRAKDAGRNRVEKAVHGLNPELSLTRDAP